jgi:5'-deoxynucleotidase YfbR-like HD superfamily hydrolase
VTKAVRRSQAATPSRSAGCNKPNIEADSAAQGAAPRAWQRMLSGRRLDLLDPSPLDIEIEDIAHGLARVARWNGQTHGDHIFSVAQHTLLTEEIARRRTGGRDRRLALALLLHDAPEYVIGDMISPFKVEHRLLDAIHLRFGLPRDLPAEIAAIIKAADRGAAFLEATMLAGFSTAEARRFFGPRPTLPAAVEKDYLMPWPAETAKRRFLQHFNELQQIE